MNAIFWLLNGLLAMLAVFFTVTVLQFQPKALPAGGSATAETRGGARKPESAAAALAAETQNRRLLATARLDPLWQNSLFRPGRTEDISDTVGGTTPEAGAKSADMELIGIGSMGKESAAIISLPDRGKGGIKPGLRPGDPAAKAPPAVKRVFKLGEAVLDTGFSVKEIRLDEVVLVRGEEERILKLEKGTPASKSRNEQAQREAASRPPTPVATPVPPPSSANIPVPPPPPPMPMSATNLPGNSPAAREERLKQAIEARRQMIEQAKKKP